MKYQISNELKNIASEIIQENRTIDEWVEIESGDQFQEGAYEGGFDATEMEFCFRVFVEEKEYWFQLSLEDIEAIDNSTLTKITLQKPLD